MQRYFSGTEWTDHYAAAAAPTTSMPPNPAGWYPNPGAPSQRYFNGTTWTQQHLPAKASKAPSARRAIAVTAVVGVAVVGLAVVNQLDDKTGSTNSISGNSPAASTAAAGSVVRDGKFAFQVLGVRIEGVAGTTDNQFMRVQAQGQFVIVDVGVQNIGNEPQTYFGNNQKLIDAAGREYAVNSAADTYVNGFIGDINPGNTIRVEMAFDVPVNTRAKALEVHDSMISGGTRVAIDDPRGS
jgi:hypothetical protein